EAHSHSILDASRRMKDTKEFVAQTTQKITMETIVTRACERKSPAARGNDQAPNRSAARAFALAASSSRFFGGALVSSERRRRVEMPAISSIASRNEASLAFDGLVNPLIFLTNWSEAALISSSVTGGSKLKSVLIFLHIYADLRESDLKNYFPIASGKPL